MMQTLPRTLSPASGSDRLALREKEDTSRWIGAAASALVHAVLIALVMTELRQAQRGSPAPPSHKTIQITMAPPAAAPAHVAQPSPAPEPPKLEQKLSTEPIPRPVKPSPPKAKPAPAPSPPSLADATTKPSAATVAPAPKPAPAVPTLETPEESLIGRIHENWLEPASMPRTFHCPIRIEYFAGGRISTIQFMRACGNRDLEESVRRAIWKSQPLPLIEAKAAAGMIEIDFTP